MTNFNQISPNFPNASRPTGQKELLENQYWFHHGLKSAEASEQTGLLKQIGSWLLEFFTDAQQVRIWTKDTKAGTVWHAYDPTTQRSISRVSEADLRVWLEERYQQ
ncbi:MAG: hypothetical protein WBB01_19300 [Phormidesmis sp.]